MCIYKNGYLKKYIQIQFYSNPIFLSNCARHWFWGALRHTEINKKQVLTSESLLEIELYINTCKMVNFHIICFNYSDTAYVRTQPLMTILGTLHN